MPLKNKTVLHIMLFPLYDNCISFIFQHVNLNQTVYYIVEDLAGG